MSTPSKAMVLALFRSMMRSARSFSVGRYFVNLTLNIILIMHNRTIISGALPKDEFAWISIKRDV